jgi:iron complex outermembrane receptor protein
LVLQLAIVNVALAQGDSDLDSLLGAPGPNDPQAQPPANAPAKSPAGQATDTPAAAKPPAEANSPSPPASGAPATSEAAIPLPAPDTDTTGKRGNPVQNRLVEEIVVTAEKREQSIESVPIAISAFSGAKLEALGVQSAEQLPKITPGLTFSNAGGFTIVFLRGVGTDAFLPSADPDVPVYIDGIATIAGQGTVNALGRVERVEVLKGPQGTLFGRNSTGGAINIITPDPTPDFHSDVQTEIGNYGTVNAHAFVNAPIIDGLGVTLAAFSEQNDTYSVSATVPTVASYSRGARGKLLWHATDGLSFNFSAQYEEQSTNKGITGVLTRPAPDLAVLLPTEPLGYTTHDSVVTGSVNNSMLLSAGADWKLPWVELKVITSNQKLNSPFQSYDYDGSPLPLLSFYVDDSHYEQATGELQILSTPDTPLALYNSWVAGAYYLEGNGGFPSLNLQVGAGAGANGGGVSGLLSAVPALDPFLLDVNKLLSLVGIPSIAGVTGPLSLVSGGLLGSRSMSGYLQDTIHVSEILGFSQPINLILGARLDKESRGLTGNRLAIVDPTGLTSNQINLFTFQVPKTSALSVPLKAELQWFPVGTTQLYTSFSRGFTSPTYSTVNFFGPPNAVKGERVDSYEVGLKTKLLDETLTLNTAAFLIQEHDILTGFVGLLSGGVVTFGNANAGRIRGLEGDFTWVPFPSLDPGLALLGSASYLNAKYTDYKNGAGYDPDTGLAFGPGNPLPIIGAPRDFSGHYIPRTPNFSYNAAINQSIPLGESSRLELNIATNYSAAMYWDAQNASQYASKAFQLLDGSLGYFYDPWGLQVQAYCKNITGVLYPASEVLLDTGRFQEPNDPRTYGVRLKYTY